jgi:ketosteroid isomerase-like protein
MHSVKLLSIFGALTSLMACSVMAPANTAATDLRREVADTERAFAKSMAQRDHAAFTSFLSEEAVFFSGAEPLQGKARVASAWKRFFTTPEAPFSWQPQQVEVLQSGTLAISSGPVHNAQGKQIATFTSIWRREGAGVWRIVFDKGNEVCDCPPP